MIKKFFTRGKTKRDKTKKSRIEPRSKASSTDYVAQPKPSDASVMVSTVKDVGNGNGKDKRLPQSDGSNRNTLQHKPSDCAVMNTMKEIRGKKSEKKKKEGSARSVASQINSRSQIKVAQKKQNSERRKTTSQMQSQIHPHDQKFFPDNVECVLSSFVENLTVTTKDLLQIEYTTILAINPHKYECIAANEYMKKFRFKEFPCIKDTRIVLPRTDLDSCDFIHANRIQLDNNRNYIATQLPLEETYDDFWRMIHNERCSAIVLLGIEHTERFFPPEVDGYQRFRNVVVKNLKRDKRDVHTLLQLDVQTDFSPENIHTTLIHDIQWPVEGIPPSTEEIVKTCKLLRDYGTEGPITVICDTGAGRSGTFVCIDAVINRLMLGKEVRVLPMVCDVRAQRAAAVYSMQQYLFIYGAVCDYFLPKLHPKQAKDIETFQSVLKSMY